MDTKQVISLIVIMVGFIGLILVIVKTFKSQCPTGMTFDKSLNKCRKLCGLDQTYDFSTDTCLDCPKGKELVDGKCVDICPSDTKRCLTGTGCYTDGVTVCDDSGAVCNADALCKIQDPSSPSPSKGISSSSKTINKCCGSSKICDKTVTPNVCIYCPETQKICNGVCCPVGQDCYGGTCCAKDRKGKTAQGVETCCDTPLCGDDKICCNTTVGESCNPDTKKCQVKCGDTFCSKDAPDCFEDDTKTPHTFTCFAANQCWGQTSYTPALLVGKDGQDYIYHQSDTKSGPVPLFQDDKSTTTPKALYITTDKDDISLTATVYGGTYASSDKCNAESCKDKLSEAGSEYITFNQLPTKSKNEQGQFICSAKLGTGASQITNADLSTICNAIGSERCCKNPDNSYTGQVCSIPGKICDNGVCRDPYKYNWDAAKSQCVVAENGKYADVKGCLIDYGCHSTSCSDPSENNCCCLRNWNTGCANDIIPMKDISTNYFDLQSIKDLNIWQPMGKNYDNIVLVFVPSDIVISQVNRSHNTFVNYLSPILTVKAVKSDLNFNIYTMYQDFGTDPDVAWVYITLMDNKTQKTCEYEVRWQAASFHDFSLVVINHNIDDNAWINIGSKDTTSFQNSKAYNAVNGSAIFGVDGDHSNIVFLSFPTPNAIPPLSSTNTKKPHKPTKKPYKIKNSTINFILITVLLTLLIAIVYLLYKFKT